MSDALQIVLRIVHILAGVFWVGGFFFFFIFIQTTAGALGPQAGPFMTHLTQVKKMPARIAMAGAVTIAAGLILYWRASGGLDLDWIRSDTGLAFTVGGVAAIIALAIGLIVIKPMADRVGVIGGAVAASGGPPSDAQMSEMQGLQGRLRRFSWVNFVLLTLAVILMAVARYL